MASVILEPDFTYEVGKIVCVGRNYVKHIEEMTAERSKDPILFLKPSTSIVNEGQPIILPNYSNDVHHEIELALLIGNKSIDIPADNWKDYVAGAGIGIDLTLRDLQKIAKQEGLPWSVCKGFDNACPISNFAPIKKIKDIQNLRLQLWINGILKQNGSTSEMIFPVKDLLAYISKIFTLEPGDIILTGTPHGVGRLQSGDLLQAKIEQIGEVKFVIR
jgi:5-carboxymethyl-2-hydroxymuconate isomerase